MRCVHQFKATANSEVRCFAQHGNTLRHLFGVPGVANMFQYPDQKERSEDRITAMRTPDLCNLYEGVSTCPWSPRRSPECAEFGPKDCKAERCRTVVILDAM